MGARTLVSHKKEKAVHTKTSTAVLFIRGANLETTSTCPAAGKGEQTTGSHSVGCPQERGGSKEGALRPGPVSYRGLTTQGGAACSCGLGADATLRHPQSARAQLALRTLAHSHSFINPTNAD